MDPYAVTFDTWNKLAQAYQDKFMDLNLYNDTYDLFCSLAKPGAKILELGCGPGNITRYLLAQRPDLAITGTDVAPAMVALAKANNPSARFAVLDCRVLHTLNGSYDGIVCGFCMPYLSRADCAKLITDVARLLHPGGLFYCSAMEGDYDRSGYETGSTGLRSYVYYHQADDIAEQLQQQGFGNVQLIRQQHPGRAPVEMIFIATKNKGADHHR
jgi:ubiquinone/menaquinone biosynthesis C-methylase UbiE